MTRSENREGHTGRTGADHEIVSLQNSTHVVPLLSTSPFTTMEQTRSKL